VKYEIAKDLKFISDLMLFSRDFVELDGTNDVLTRSYVWGLDPSGTMDGALGVGGFLWVTLHTASGAAAGTHFAAYDGNGNVVALSAASDGSETGRYEYGPFGEQIRVTGPAANLNPFRFSTKRTCNTTDLVLYEYRAYSPALGRWLSRDPLRERAGRNLFGFVGNSPLGYLDPWGLKWRKMNCIAISVVGGGSAYRWVGVSIRAEVRAETCDCCDDETGETRPRDYRKISGTAKGSAGLGFGAEVELPIVGEVGWVIKGPQVSGSATLSWCKACGDKAPPEVTLEFLKTSGELGGSFSIGGGWGGRIEWWANYEFGLYATLGGHYLSAGFQFGGRGGGQATIITPVVELNFPFSLYDDRVKEEVVHLDF